MQKVIEAQNLQKTYILKNKTTINAVNNVSFFVNRNEIFGLLGPNGAGKTTTLEIIEGLNKQDSGIVKVLSFDNINQNPEIKKQIGVQLQSSDYLPYLTLNELLKLFGSLYKKTVDLKALLTLVNLEEKANEYPKNLSGGQKQRFSIASSLVNEPKILFLDEPTTGLDPSARKNLWVLIKKLNAQGLTIVLTTHNMEEAEYLCHRVAIMDAGKILKIDEPKKLIDNLSHTTQISFLVEQPIDEKIFVNCEKIEKIYNDFPKIILEVKSLDNISKIIDLLKEYNIKFSGFTVKTASLEDVYLKLTGHEYESN